MTRFAQQHRRRHDDVSADPPTVRSMRRMWHIWPGNLWPASLLEERRFVADLQERASRPSKATRDDVTALISILRCGATVEEALAFAPGLKAGKLLSAHRRLDSLRLTSVEAWDRIAADPTPARWKADRRAAAKLFPVAVDRVAVALETDPSERRLVEIVTQVNQRMRDLAATAEAIERKIVTVPRSLPYSGTLSASLYTPHGACVYGDPFFVPDRVSVLSPTRIGDLLGEPHA